MANLKEVRIRIASVHSTQQITKAMKMVAAAKLRKAQNNAMQLRPYADKLSSILQNVSATLDGGDFENPYAEIRPIRNVLIIVVTSDKGLCGGFNANVVKGTASLIAEKYAQQAQSGCVEIMTVGKKGFDAFRKRNYKLNSEYALILGKKDFNFDDIKPAAEFAMKGFAEGRYDAVEIVYNEFKNVATQVVRREAFLPIAPKVSDASSDKSSNPKKADASNLKAENTDSDYIFEPNKIEILTELIPKSLKLTFYRAVLESVASEHGARMTAMDKATENAGSLLTQLKLTYNQTRQAHITKEILEIVGGAEALASS